MSAKSLCKRCALGGTASCPPGWVRNSVSTSEGVVSCSGFEPKPMVPRRSSKPNLQNINIGSNPESMAGLRYALGIDRELPKKYTYRSELEAAQARCAELCEERALWQSAHDALLEENERLRKEHKEQLAELGKSIRRRQPHCDAVWDIGQLLLGKGLANYEPATVMSAVRKLCGERNALREKRNTAQIDLELSREASDSWKAEVSRLTEQRNALREERDALNKKLDYFRGKCNRQKEECGRLRTACDRMRGERSESDSELARMRKTLRDLLKQK